MVISQGEMFWLDLPEPKGSEPGYRRPCLVVQNNTFNRSRIATIVVCILTTNLKLAKAPGNVLLSKGEANLSKASVVNISQVLTINKSDLQPNQKIGQLTKQKLDLVISGFKLLIEPS